VTPQATLVGDLGAESIDFLDIVFRLEKAFDIKVPRAELFPEDVLANAQYVQQGKLSAEGLKELKKRMPFANLDEFTKNPVVKDFVNHIDYAVKLIGIDHVGISSDFDGGGGIDGWNSAAEAFNSYVRLPDCSFGYLQRI